VVGVVLEFGSVRVDVIAGARTRVAASRNGRTRVFTEARRKFGVVDIQVFVEREDRLSIRNIVVVCTVVGADVRSIDDGVGGDVNGRDDAAVGVGGNVDVNLLLGERLNAEDEVAEVVESHTLLGVEGEDLSEDGQALFGDGEDATEESRVLEESGKRLVRGRRAAPWVTAADEVDENHTKRPNIGRTSSVRGDRV
jgi:hypothetical protein